MSLFNSLMHLRAKMQFYHLQVKTQPLQESKTLTLVEIPKKKL